MSEANFTRKELYDLVWSEPIASLAKKFNTTFEEFRKLCKSQQIPVPPTGYWMKLKYGKSVDIIPLGEIDFKLKDENNSEPDIIIPTLKEVSPLMTLQKEIENDSNISLIVSPTLNKPDILITQAKDTILNPGTYENDYKSKSGFHWWQVLKIDVSINNLDRALRFMDTLIKALKQRGHIIKPGKETYVVIQDEEIKVNCREKNKRVNIQGKYGNTTELIPTGILIFNIEGSLYGKEWKDGKQKLEEQLSNIIAKLELEGKRKKEQTESAKKWRLEYEEQKRIEFEEKKAKEKEVENFKSLLDSAKRYHEAVMLREYVDVMEAKKITLNGLNAGMAEWFKWARIQADLHDPTMNLTDSSILDSLANHCK